MDTPEKRKQLEQLGLEIFELSKMASQARAQARRDGVETLTETENLTLDLLSKRETMSVGEIQKEIGVLPAQMSRIVRALEDKGEKGYIACAINPDDRRKIDVSITPAGRKALETYRSERMGTIMRILAHLQGSERDEFMRLMRRIRELFSNSLKKK